MPSMWMVLVALARQEKRLIETLAGCWMPGAVHTRQFVCALNIMIGSVWSVLESDMPNVGSVITGVNLSG